VTAGRLVVIMLPAAEHWIYQQSVCLSVSLYVSLYVCLSVCVLVAGG